MTLEAIYYPYSRAIIPSTLRKAALLFDALYFLDSEPWFVRDAITRATLMSDPKSPPDLQIEEDYRALKAEGFVQVLDAASFVHDYDELLTANVVDDVRNDEFCRLAIEYSANAWSILAERIPPSLLQALYPGAGMYSEAVNLQATVNASIPESRMEDESAWGLARFRERFSGPVSQGALEEFLDDSFKGYRYVIGGNHVIKLPSYHFPFLHASSLRINECLVAAATKGLTPYTDSMVHDSLLRLKVNRALAEIGREPELQKQLSIDLPLRFPRQSIALEILDHLIPSEAFDRIPVSDLLRYRSQNRRRLARFHAYLEVLATEIEGVVPDQEYEIKIKRIVSSRVIPELTKARDDLLTSYEDAFGNIITTSGVAVASTVTATIFSGLDTWHVLAAGAVAGAGALGAKAPAELLKAWKGKRVNSRSPLAYVANLNP